MSGVEPKRRDESVVFHEQMDKNRDQRGERRRRRLEATEEITQIRARWQAVSMNLLSTSTEKE